MRDKPAHILIVEDDADMADSCRQICELDGYMATIALSAETALESLSKGLPDVVLTDLRLTGLDGVDLLKRIKAKWPQIEVILMTGYGTIQTAVRAMKLGAADYITKPFHKEEILGTLRKIFSTRFLQNEVHRLQQELKKEHGAKNLVGKSSVMREIFDRIQAAAANETAVLITGESGTGKELVAHAIHYNSDRQKNPFIAINCAALPSHLIESELFGHKKGAFTGANQASKGLFRAAEKGTLFLDEIAEMPSETQSKLLRVLQDKKIRPVGEIVEKEIDVRVIAATNRNIDQALQEGNLRKDLFYRLSVLLISIPPLRERGDDIPLLVTHFLNQFSKKYRKKIDGWTSGAMELLMDYSWPGNVREMENLIENCFISPVSGKIDKKHIHPLLNRNLSLPNKMEKESLNIDNKKAILIRRALDRTHGNKTEAAEILGISRTSLYRKLKAMDS